MGTQLSTPYVPEPAALPDAPGKKHVCLIGAGSSSLILMKELKELGHTVQAFDTLPVVGGVYVKSYENTLLTTSSVLTAFSMFSDGKEHSPKFWTAEEYLEYLGRFVEKFDLEQDISFRTSVEHVEKNTETGKWEVTVLPGRACEDNPRYGKGCPEDPNAELEVHEFDAVCICSGTNNWASLPKFDGQDEFLEAGGELVHSDTYRRPEDYQGKRVLVVGAGESGSDICNEVSKCASKCAIVIRGKHGHLIPRKQANGRTTDLNTNRLRYANPYILGDWVGWTNQLAKKFVAQWSPQTDEARVLAKIGELNLYQRTSAFSKFGCKNAGFVEAIVLRGTELHRDAFRLEAGKAIFADGSEFECDTVIACTGFRNSFPMFEEKHPEVAAVACNPRSLYKQIFHTKWGSEIACFGFARPAFGSLPPTVEMQARYYALVLNGERQLPSQDEMERIAAVDAAEWERRFSDDAVRIKGLVDFMVYTDDLAKLIGCFPPLMELFWNKFNVWYKIMCGPFTMHQYRLVGPYADPQRAEEVYSRTPVGDFLESSITASYLVVAKTLSLLGFSEFTPNNF